MKRIGKGRTKFKTGIRLKIAFFICLSTFIIMSVGLIVGYFLGFRLLEATIGKGNVQLAEDLAHTTTVIIEQALEKTTFHSTNPIYRDAIRKSILKCGGEDPAAVNKHLLEMDKKWAEAKPDSPLVAEYLQGESAERLKKCVALNKSIAEAFVTDKFGGLVAASGKTSDFYQADEAWWQEAYNGGSGAVYVGNIAYDESIGKNAMTVAVPVKDEKDKVIGVCKFIFDADILFRPLGDFKIGETGHAVLVDDEGMIIYHRAIEPLTVKVCSDKEFKNLINDPKGWRIISSPHIHKGKDMLVALAVVNQPFLLEKGIIWRVFVDEETQEVFLPVNKLFTQMSVVTGILVLILIPVGLIFGSIFVKPIRKLHEATEHIEKGELDYPIEVKTNDEVEQLADSFKSMMAALKSKQKEVQEAKVYAENIISSMTDTLIVVTPEATIKNINRATCDLLGYTEEELIEKDVSLIFIEEEEEEEEEEEMAFKPAGIKKLIKEGSVQNIDLKYRTKNGDKIPVSFSGSVMRDESGELVGIVGVARDMRQIKELITDLEQAKSELEDWSKTLEEKIEEKTKGLRQSQEATLHILEDLQVSKDELEEKTKRLDESLMKSEKSRDVTISMLDDNNKITKELEKRLKELKDTQNMLVQTEKLSSLGHLVSEMAHEVNNPLQAISGRAQLSLMDEIPNKELEENLKIIENQCYRARDIIKRLLEFSRPSKGEVKEMDLKDIADDTIKLVEHQYTLAGIEILREYSPDEIKVKVDVNQIEEVFFNIVKNASEAMESGGSITVSTSKEGGKARIAFKDTGSGIPEEVMKNIFDPFYTTKDDGTGVGLSVCYGLIKDHGGELRYESKPGEGTTAIITFPMEG